MPNLPEKQVRVRMAPSPTGSLHIGGARTALFNWLFARQNGGVFVLRIEDTDKERSEKKYEAEILEGFSWLGIDWDEGPIANSNEDKGSYGPYRQSDRLPTYKKYLEQLLEKGGAYYCYCTKEDLEAEKQDMAARGLPPKYSGHCRNLKEPPAGKVPQVIRFRVPETKIEFKDMIRGKVIFDSTLFGDIVIAKDVESPLYNFAVVVDDAEMKITHVIRGEEHLSNTPRQILMQKALGFDEVIYAHIPLILNDDRSKMSKRFGDVALLSYREKGYLPDAILNFIALLGWHPKGNQEVFSKEELIKEFDITRVQKGGAIFSYAKLDWLNKEYLKTMSDAEIADICGPMFIEEGIRSEKTLLEKIVSVVRSRATTIRSFVDMGKFFFDLPDYEETLLIWEDATKKDVVAILKEILSSIVEVSDDNFSREVVLAEITKIIGIRKRGEVLWPLRVALSGLVSSPDPIDIMTALGKEESLRRIENALQKLNK